MILRALLRHAAFGSVALMALSRAHHRAVVRARVDVAAHARRSPVLGGPGRVALLARALERADLATEPAAALVAWLLAAASAGLLVAVDHALALTAVVIVLGAGPAGLWLARDRRDRRAALALPAILELVAHELRGGGTMHQAMARLAERPGPLRLPIERVVARCRLGLSLPEALDHWAAEQPIDGVRPVAAACAVAASLGGPAARALDELAGSLREQHEVRAEARALATQARLSAVVVGCAPLAAFAFSSVAAPASLHALTSTAPGRMCLLTGLVLDAAGALWMRRIVRCPA